MPNYSYACTECGHAFDIYQAFTDDALTTCPQCQGMLRKKFSAVGVVFKGSGFYRNDARSTPEGPAGKGSGSKDSSSTDSSSKDGGKDSGGKDGAKKADGAGSASKNGSSSTSGSSGSTTKKPAKAGAPA